MTPPLDDILDVAIVGGGVSGVYTAWRLMNDASPVPAGNPLKVALFEGSAHIGGRLISITPPEMPHVVGELGGMQFMGSQRLVSALVENRLHLAVTSEQLTKRNAVSLEAPDLAYLRGQHLHHSDLTVPRNIPYGVDWSERGRTPSDLIRYALESQIPGVTTKGGKALDKLLEKACVEGRPLYQWGFWELINRALSEEAYAFIHDSGYSTLLLNLNAIDLIREWQVYYPKQTFTTITQGYNQLPLTLCDQFRAAGGQVYLRWRLKSVNAATLQDGKSGVEMILCRDSKGWGPDECENPVRVYARALILALPQRALELLDQTGPLFQPRVRRLLNLVMGIPMYKLLLCYHYPWWQTLGLDLIGRVVTDMPLRQCFYWAIENQQPFSDPDDTNALMMVYFDDALSMNYWSPLWHPRELPPVQPVGMPDRLEAKPPEAHALSQFNPTPYQPGQTGVPMWSDYQTQITHRLLAEVQRQLHELHDLRYIPSPYAAASIYWGDDPYGGAVHFWKHDVPGWEYAPLLIQPVQGLPAYICGEAYSNMQGWVEGALETAEAVLQHPSFPYRLAPPAWLTQS